MNDLIEILSEEDEEESVDDEDNDKDYGPTEADLKMLKEDKREEMKAKKRKTVSKKKSATTGKGGKNDEIKKVAAEVSKYKYLYEVDHPKFMDRQMQSSAWKKVSEVVGINIDTCKSHWESLKRRACYHGKETKVPYKSGASSTDDEVQKKHKKGWEFAEVMSFYTPPSLKEKDELVSVLNKPSTSFESETEVGNATMISNEDSSSTMLTELSESNESIYVSNSAQFIFF